MLDFRMPCLLELKIPQMHFLKRQKKAKNASKKTVKNRGSKTPKSPGNIGSNADVSLRKTKVKRPPKTSSKHLYLGDL
jgi:hypothetical protein